jgi:hypothetical protein
MKVRINGRELRVVKSTRVLVEWQNQSGKPLKWLASDEGQVYSLAYMAFCALQNAGFEPKWDELLDVDTEEWEFIKEPKDKIAEESAPVPPNSLAGSGAGGEGSTAATASPASKPSRRPRAGSTSK